MMDFNRGENLEFKELLQEIQRLQSPDAPVSVLLEGIQLPAGKAAVEGSSGNFEGWGSGGGGGGGGGGGQSLAVLKTPVVWNCRVFGTLRMCVFFLQGWDVCVYVCVCVCV